jgi:peptidoglycan hydrolase-like protein with peptidoglycan-binding domain
MFRRSSLNNKNAKPIPNQKKEMCMKSKTLLTSGAVLVAAWMTSGQVLAQSPETPRGSQSGGTENVRGIQQALKDKGHDPGPVDGVMGRRTADAIKSFQTASNLKATGTLNAETADKLGVQASASQNMGSTTSSGAVKERDDNRKSKSGNLNEPGSPTSGSQGSTGSKSGSTIPGGPVKERDDDRKSK